MKPTRRDMVAFIKLYELAEEFRLLERYRFEPTNFNDQDLSHLKSMYDSFLQTPGVRAMYREHKTYEEVDVTWKYGPTPEEYAEANGLDLEYICYPIEDNPAVVRFGGPRPNIMRLRRERRHDIEA